MSSKIGIILGSGLNNFANELESPKVIFEDNNSFHKLRIFSGKVEGKNVMLFSGRRHFYEGYSRNEIVENVIKANQSGIKFLIVTNAAGGINGSFKVSDLMIITSHYNFLNNNFSQRGSVSFYDKKLNEKIKILGRCNKMNLRCGSYLCSPGPMYETKSEIKFLSDFGVDAVGMSTVPEVTFANSIGIKTLALSCITNMLSENSQAPVTHNEVIEAGAAAYANFSKLLKIIILNSEELIN